MVQQWAPRNGWPLASVASKRGWPVWEVPGATVAYADNGATYVDGELTQEGIEALAELGISL